METMAQRRGSMDDSFHLPNFPHRVQVNKQDINYYLPGSIVIADPMKNAAPTIAPTLRLLQTKSKCETYEDVCGWVYLHALRGIEQRAEKFTFCESTGTPGQR